MPACSRGAGMFKKSGFEGFSRVPPWGLWGGLLVNMIQVFKSEFDSVVGQEVSDQRASLQ